MHFWLFYQKKLVSSNFFHEIAFLAFLNFFPAQKLNFIFWPILKLKKMEFGKKKKIREIDFYSFISKKFREIYVRRGINHILPEEVPGRNLRKPSCPIKLSCTFGG